jgi:hypothetical protein
VALDLNFGEDMDDHRREALLKEYGEVSNNFRLLTDIRFKLLAFLPIATAAAAALKGDSLGIGSFALSLFGLTVTIGLVTYNTRNDQLYDELVGRAASIERSLGLPDGAFANRPRPWLTIRFFDVNWTIDHRTGIGIIYGASIALWLFGSFAPILEVGRRTYLQLGLRYFVVPDPSVWVHIFALVLAVLVTALLAEKINVQTKQRAKEMRSLAAQAVERARSVEFSQAAKDDTLLSLCARLAGANADIHIIRARAQFYAAIDSESLSYYLPRDSREQTAAHFVALLTDLPPRWLFDCATNRRGSVAFNEEV